MSAWGAASVPVPVPEPLPVPVPVPVPLGVSAGECVNVRVRACLRSYMCVHEGGAGRVGRRHGCGWAGGTGVDGTERA